MQVRSLGCTHTRSARPCEKRHVRAVPRDSSPYGINQVKKTCRKVLTLGSAHPACFVPLLVSRAERGLSCHYPRAPLIARPWNAMYSQGIFSSGFTRLTSARSCSANLLKWTREIAREGRTKKKKKKKNWEIMGGRKRAERQREREWKRRMANVRERAKEWGNPLSEVAHDETS